MTEKELEEHIRLAKNKDNHALQVLYENFYKEVYYTCLQMLKDENTAKDMTQDVFLKAFEKLNELNNAGNFPGWIRRIASRMSLNYLKRSRLIEFTDIDTEDVNSEAICENGKTPEDIAVDNEVVQILKQAIDKLPEDQRICVFMYYYQNYSVREIAEEIGCSENTVRGKLRYASNNLRKHIEKLDDGNIKLRCIAVLPFLYIIFKTDAASLSPSPEITPLSAQVFTDAALATTAKTGLSAGAIAGICGGAAAVVAAVGAAVLISLSVKDKPNSVAETDGIKPFGTFMEIDNVSDPFLFGKYIYYYDETEKVHVVKDIERDTEVVRTAGVWDYRDCGSSVISIAREDSTSDVMDVYIYDKNGQYFFRDKMYVGDVYEEGCYAYFSRENAIDDFVLSETGDFVFLSVKDEVYTLKSFNLENGSLNYEKIMPLGVISGKNEYFAVYHDIRGNRNMILNIANGEEIDSFTGDNVYIDNIRLMGQYYAVFEGEIKKMTNYKRFDINGNMDVDIDFDAKDSVRIDDAAFGTGYGQSLMMLKRYSDENRQIGIFKSDMEPVVDFIPDNVYSPENYCSYGDIYCIVDIEQGGFVCTNGGENVFEAVYLAVREDYVIADTVSGNKYVFDCITGGYFEIPAEAGVKKTGDYYGSDYVYIVSNDAVYNKNGEKLFDASASVYYDDGDYNNTKNSLTHQWNSPLYVYNDIEGGQNTIYVYDASRDTRREFNTKENVKSAFMADDINIIYSARADSDKGQYKYISVNTQTGEETLLFYSDFGIVYGCSQYGFVVGSDSTDWMEQKGISCEIVSY